MKIKLKRKIKSTKTIPFAGRYITFIPKKIYNIDNETLINHLFGTGFFMEHIVKPKKKKKSKKKIPEPVLEKRPESEEEEKPWVISNQ